MRQSLVGTAVVLGFFAHAPLAARAEVVCDRFDLRVTEDAERLLISIDTDLPNDTVLMAYVGRSYWQHGKREEYTRYYLEERSNVGSWRSPRPVSVADDGVLEVEKVSDEIEVRFVVPVYQPNPAFGALNRNLTGRRVQTQGLRTIMASVRVRRPLGAETRVTRSPDLDARKLVNGDLVRVSRRTHFFPSEVPEDPFEAGRAVRYIEPGTVFQVFAAFNDERRQLWYSVRVLDATGAVTDTGNINSTALIGQDLERAE